MERKKLFDLLRDQNYWFKEPMPTEYILRENYIKKVNELMDSRAILVMKGPRRAGKTVLLDQIIQQMLKNKTDREQILYVNLEDYRFYKDYSLKLLEDILEVYLENINAGKKVYFIIDEIQNINGFERFLRTKYDHQKNIKFIITGSNAKLLSKELGTLLTGRITTIEILPFSFSEFLLFHKIMLPENRNYFTLESEKTRIKQMFNRYLRFGAIPEFLLEKEPEHRLKEYFENVLFRDVVERFNIRNVKLIKELALYLATNSAKIYSVNQLSKILNASVNTVQSYLSDLSMAYLFFYVDKFSFSLKDQITSQSKVYSLDTGLINAVGFKFSEDKGRLLENLVYLELLREEKEVYYHRDPKMNRECDFIVKEGLKVAKAIQVTSSLDDKKTEEREIEGMIDALKTYNLKEGFILTENEYGTRNYEEFEIKIRPMWFWLLNKEG
ncbi:MAG: ATP-binding protein [Thermoplasmatales archaeon]|nr:ATP-binding protein [Thermoplasmatales archaeon]